MNLNWFLVSFLFLSSCTLFQRKEDTPPVEPVKVEHKKEIPPILKNDNIEKPSPVIPDDEKQGTGLEGITDVQLPNSGKPPIESSTSGIKKVAIILGPGGLRSFAHVGVLQQLSKNKIGITAIAGIEMGSLVASLYSRKAQTYDVEWQMGKLKEENFFDKGLLTDDKPAPLQKLIPYLKSTFEQTKVEDGKIPFSCLAFNLSKQQNIVMNRGIYFQMLPFCIAMNPLFQPFQSNIAATTELKSLVDYLRSKGAQYVIYVDILGNSSGKYYKNVDNVSNLSWNIINQSLQKQMGLVDFVIKVPLEKFGLADFNSRREIVQIGSEAAIKDINEILKRTRNP